MRVKKSLSLTFGNKEKVRGLLALAILIGTIVGAGIFAIPYTIAKSGIISGFFYFLILGISVLLLHLCFGEIILRTKEKYRLPGYSQKYLGKLGKTLITISTILGTTGVLLAYLILGGEFLRIVFTPFINFSSFNFSFIFWFILIYFIFKGIKLIGPAEILPIPPFLSLYFWFLVFCFLKLI